MAPIRFLLLRFAAAKVPKAPALSDHVNVAYKGIQMPAELFSLLVRTA